MAARLWYSQTGEIVPKSGINFDPNESFKMGWLDCRNICVAIF
jgi:hypothetical protein